MRNSRMILSASAANAERVSGASAVAALAARSARRVSAKSDIPPLLHAQVFLFVSRRCGTARASAPHFCRCRENGPDDARISCATANLAGHSFAHLPLAADL